MLRRLTSRRCIIIIIIIIIIEVKANAGRLTVIGTVISTVP